MRALSFRMIAAGAGAVTSFIFLTLTQLDKQFGRWLRNGDLPLLHLLEWGAFFAVLLVSMPKETTTVTARRIAVQGALVGYAASLIACAFWPYAEGRNVGLLSGRALVPLHIFALVWLANAFVALGWLVGPAAFWVTLKVRGLLAARL
jgi:hypothetical protein